MPMHGFSDTMEKHFLIGRDFEVSKKILTVALLFAVISTGFLWADNQVITSSRVEGALAEEMSTQTTWAGYAQQLGMEARTTQADASDIAQMRLMAARGDAGYPVTVGDIYTLSYIYNNQVVTIAIEIGHSPTVNVAGIGSFDTTSRTFAQFKAEVEAAVTSRYPYSSPTLTITAVGAFSVHVSGMVKTSAHVEAWGLTRLSDMAWYAMDNASTRDVTPRTGQDTGLRRSQEERDIPAVRPDDHHGLPGRVCPGLHKQCRPVQDIRLALRERDIQGIRGGIRRRLHPAGRGQHQRSCARFCPWGRSRSTARSCPRIPGPPPVRSMGR